MIWWILILAFLLRLVTLDQSLWLDEAINVLAAKNLSWFDFVARYPIGDFHPPGYFALLWPFTRIFGFSEIAVRMPSLLLGVGTVYLTYLLGKKLFDKKIAGLAALFLAVGPLHVFYSQEARMYSLAAFSVALSSYFLVKWVKGEPWARWAYLISAVLVFYSDYVAYLIFPAHLLYILFIERKIMKEFILSWVSAFIFFLPWAVTTFPQQFLEGQKASLALPGWKQVAGGANFRDLSLVWVETLVGRVSFEDKRIYAGVVGALSLLWGVGGVRGILGSWGKLGKEYLLLFFWVGVPLTMAFLISFFIPMLSYFRMVFILPAFYLLAAFGFSRLPKHIFRPSVLLAVFFSLTFLGIYYTNPKFQREDWRGAVAFVESKLDDNSTVLFESNSKFSPYVFYSNDSSNVLAGLAKIPAGSNKDVQNLNVLLQGKHEVYLFEYLVDITDPGRFLEKELESNGFSKSQVYDFAGVGFINFYRRL